MEYETKDLIMPILKFPDPTVIRITEDEEFLRLYIGPRDFQFDKKTGRCVGRGTCLS